MAAHKILRTYRFTDKDPVKDELQTVLSDVGLMSKKGLQKVAVLANLSYATLDALFYGSTRRPHNATVMGIVTAVGYERVFRPARRLNVEEELPFAKAFNKKDRARVQKARAAEPKKVKKRKRA